MEILLIRHGESEADILNVHEGRADFTLTKQGKRQAEILSSQFIKNKIDIDVVWSSTLKRASETAEILKSKLKCSVIYNEDLRERNNGVLAGQPITKENVNSHYDLKPFECIQDGETDIEFRARVETILLRILDAQKNSNRIAIVSHGGVIEKLIHILLKFPSNPNCYVYTSDTGVHLIEYNSSRTIIKYLNNTEHLKEISKY